ncbi:hypothetical protein FQN54_006639 [Arachnomyces sp. PD_36]|nr:hypothetical protein FQN54_006639 [Arachnomyces sp. PD_36]
MHFHTATIALFIPALAGNALAAPGLFAKGVNLKAVDELVRRNLISRGDCSCECRDLCYTSCGAFNDAITQATSGAMCLGDTCGCGSSEKCDPMNDQEHGGIPATPNN